MNYSEALDFLYSQLPMYQRQGKTAFKKDLNNIKALCTALGEPQTKFRSIHIAGTNGKGSTSHMLASILTAAGYKTGLYTSPHYRDYRERIRIDGQMMGKRQVSQFVDRHEVLIRQVKPSFFEMSVAMAFEHFADQGVDVAVIETGLGGRLDSTNILFPEISIITNIGWDHMDMLGNTLPDIAAEKAGIIKRETPVIIGEYQQEVASVFQVKAAECGAPISFADQEWESRIVGFKPDSQIIDIYWKDTLWLKDLFISNGGAFQQRNILPVMAAVSVFKANSSYYVPEKAIRQGLGNMHFYSGFTGRWQKLGDRPLIIADSAHNEQGLESVMKHIQSQEYERLHFILGMVNDKDLSRLLPLLPRNGTYYFCRPNIPRGLDAGKLRQTATAYALYGKCYSSVRKALAAARRKANENDFIYVGGSSFVVAEVV